MKDRYIVVLNKRTDPEHLGRTAASAAGGRLHFVYRHALHGFAATLPAPAVEALRGNPNVTRIEPDLVAHVVGSGSASAASWGLDRIDQRSGLNGTYSWTTSGAGVTVYILDTGIRFTHAEFGGRARPGFDAIGDGQNGNDCNGHGTHVAGTVGGATYGVAKDVTLVSVRVLGCNGSGAFSGVIAGVDWVTANSPGPSVANMSLGAMDLFGTSTSLDKAVQNSINSGVSYALAAGNDAFDACFYTPARVANAITVGATEQNDVRAYFSNDGNCVDLFAPGVGILSAWNTGDGATNSISGTSMATPHTAGVAALYLELEPTASPVEVSGALANASTRGVVVNAVSPNNHLLYSRLDGSEPPPPPSGNQPPVASFTFTCDALTCTFTDGSTDPDGTVAARSWAFGDGATSTAQSASHTYAGDGTYTVSLTVTDDDGATGATSQNVTVAGPNQPPTASFTYSCVDLTCSFTDHSTDGDGTVISWLWEFGDGNQAFIQSPSHTFGAAGTYIVALTAIDDDLATGRTTRTVTVGGPATNLPPTAAFTASCSDLTCTFTDGSADSDGTLTSWSWTFGDGGASTAPSPSHTYAAAGTYTVSLTVTDDDGATNATSQSVTVTAPNLPPTAAFTPSCSDLTCTFTDGSSDSDGTLVAWSWTFGDGGGSTAPSPTHSYTGAGTYTVSLTVTDDAGAANSTSRQVTVTQPGPVGPTVTACSPASANANDQIVVQVTGSGFQSGATGDFGDRIMVQKADFVSPSLLEFRIKVHAKAPPGARAVTIRNPDGQSGTNPTCFTVN